MIGVESKILKDNFNINMSNDCWFKLLSNLQVKLISRKIKSNRYGCEENTGQNKPF